MTDSADIPTGSLEAIQSFDPASIARTETLGSAMDFTSAIPVVQGVVQFFRLLPPQLLVQLPTNQQNEVRARADACWATMKFMMQFNPRDRPNPVAERDGAVSQLQSQFSETVEKLGPSVAFLSAIQRSDSAPNTQLQTLLRTAKKNSIELELIKKNAGEEVSRILGEVRSLAAEAGVSQQATYFDTQAGKHKESASTWQISTYATAIVLVLFAAFTWWLGYRVVPVNGYQAAQFAISKVLIFSTIAFILYLSSRTLMAHRHNEVVNRHRQNALLTFNALADAAGEGQTRDVVLTHASQCIFAPQDSGFMKPSPAQTSPSMIEIVPKIMGAEHLG